MVEEHEEVNKGSEEINDLKDMPLNDQLAVELNAAIKDLPESKRKEILNAFMSISVRKSSFCGPIPPPELLKGYNEVVKDGAERIVVLAEKQSAHRMQLEDYAIKEEIKQSGRGQIFGFILGIIGLGLATLLAIYGFTTIAGIFGTTTILGLVTIFVIGKKNQEKELSEK